MSLGWLDTQLLNSELSYEWMNEWMNDVSPFIITWGKLNRDYHPQQFIHYCMLTHHSNMWQSHSNALISTSVFDFCKRISCCGYMLQLAILAVDRSGFQASCHNMLNVSFNFLHDKHVRAEIMWTTRLFYFLKYSVYRVFHDFRA
jgi:hypothetical protein